MRNPFTIGIAEGDAFCNRETELQELMDFARNGQKIVFYSPRRYGKSSLIFKVLEALSKEGFFVAYTDLFSVTSESDFISKLATSVLRGIGKGADPRTLTQKALHLFKKIIPAIELGPDGAAFSVRFDNSEKPVLLLDDLMEGILAYTKKKKIKACIALDEFQEITELKEAKRIEGTLRSHIQRHTEISYFFIGSRRRILTDMFTGKGRPFYKSAFLYTFSEISCNDFASYISDMFKKTGKNCNRKNAEAIYSLVQGHPYYVQKLSSLCWDMANPSCDSNVINTSWKKLIQVETAEFEGIWGGLTLVQKMLFKALSKEPTLTIFSKTYLEGYGLSVGGTQKALRQLLRLDLVGKKNEIYTVIDPVFREWLKMQ